MSCGFFSTDSISNSTAPCSFAIHATNEEKVTSSKTCDLVIDYENSIVDLSNLVYSRRSLLSGKFSTKNSGLKKPARSLRRLYPSKSKVNVLQDGNNASYIFAKSRMEQQFRPKKQLLPRQASIIRRRSLMDQDRSKIYFGSSIRSLGRGLSFKRTLSFSYLLDEAQDYELVSSGAYDGTPTDNIPTSVNLYTTTTHLPSHMPSWKLLPVCLRRFVAPKKLWMRFEKENV
jgi:hypothetical protein